MASVLGRDPRKDSGTAVDQKIIHVIEGVPFRIEQVDMKFRIPDRSTHPKTSAIN